MSCKVYTCQICGKVSKQTSHWRDHQATHSEIRNYKCTICTRGFKTRGAMRFHYQKSHTLAQFYKAINLMESKETSKQPVAKNVSKATLENLKSKNKINPASTSIKNMPKLSQTTKSSTNFNSQPIKCSICNFVIRHGRNFKKHMQRHKNSNRVCPVINCGMKFTWIGALKLHMKEIHAEISVKNEKAIKPTLRISSRTEVKKYTEDEDEEQFEHDQSLLEEVPSESQNTKLKISSCYSLNDVKEVEPKEEEEQKSYRYECGECNIGFHDNDDLWKHLFEKHLRKEDKNENKTNREQPVGRTRNRRTR